MLPDQVLQALLHSLACYAAAAKASQQQPQQLHQQQPPGLGEASLSAQLKEQDAQLKAQAAMVLKMQASSSGEFSGESTDHRSFQWKVMPQALPDL